MKTGAELRAAREAARLTQVQVAEALGITRATVIAWEHRAQVSGARAQRYLRAVEALAGKE